MTPTPRSSPATASTPSDRLRAEILTAARLEAESPAWDDLFARAVAPNPHYSRHVIEAHLASGLAPEDLAVIVVRRGDRLDAILPFRLIRDLSGLGLTVAQPFHSPFVTATTPLVAKGTDFAGTLACLVAGLQEASGGRAWRWPLLSTHGEVGEELLNAMAAAGWATATVAAFERPILDRRADHDAFLTNHPHRSRLKDLRRRQRRLAESGTLVLDTWTEGLGLRDAVEAFLSLEQAGWKGEAGTALACRPDQAAFARALFSPSGGPVRARADLLHLDGRPIAISLALVAGGTACLLKTAYDEGQRANAPGLVLEAEIVRALHETAFADRLDSATLAGSALESLYPDREAIAEIIAMPQPGGALSLERRVRLARFEHAARAEAKRRLGR